MRLFFTILILLLYLDSECLDYENDIKYILNKHCVSCHKENGIAPFSLTTYKQLIKYKSIVAKVIETGYMPPWKPDPAYSHFLGERVLSNSDKKKLKEWIQNGSPQGRKSDLVSLPAESLQMHYSPKTDLVFKVPFPVTIVPSINDTNVFIEIPYELERDTFISYYEFLPGPSSGIHHAFIFIQDTEHPHGEVNFEDNFDGDFWDGKSFHYRSFSSRYLAFAGGWVPGQLGVRMPEGTGFILPRKGVLVYQLHYGPTSKMINSKFDLRITFSDKRIERVAKARKFGSQGGIVEPYPPLLVPPDTVMKFTFSTPFPEAYSVIAMAPHMHLLGKSFKVWVIRLNGDTMPMISIRDWDFNWQGYYYPSHLIKVEKGDKLEAEVILDNTSKNIRNPHSPPEFVKFGSKTSDEMIQFSLYIVSYKSGDEKLSIEN